MSTQLTERQFTPSGELQPDVSLLPRFLSTQYAFVAVLVIGLFTLAARDLSDSDFWWHLRTGQLILETRAVPHVDPFSYTRAGHPWIAHEWLSELMFFLVFRVAGKGALITIFALIITAAFLLAYRRSKCNAYVAGVVTLCGALASVPSWGVRPQMFSLLLTSLFLILLDSSAQQPRRLLWLPPLMLLWVNLHGGFPIGIVLIAVYLLGCAWESVGHRPPHLGTRIRQLTAALLACLAVIAINPNGLRLYLYPFQTLRLRALQHISEWRSPDAHHVAFVLFFALLVATFLAVTFSKCKIRVHELLLLIGAGVAGLHTIRHIPIFALIAIPILSRHADNLLANRSWSRAFFVAHDNSSFVLRALNAVTLLFILSFAGLCVYHTLRQVEDNEVKNFPSGAVSFLATRHVPTPLFNHYDWGGYLIWRLYPEYRVWVDGRTDLYGDAFLEEFLRIYWAQKGWQRQLDNQGIRTVIVPSNSPLAHALSATPEWQTIYQDWQAVICVRRLAPH
jgi:hypothetical protein